MQTQNSASLVGLFFLSLSIFATIGIASQSSSTSTQNLYAEPVPVEQVEAKSIKELKNIFAELDYTWPPSDNFPTHIITRYLPESFSNIKNAAEKKKLFVQILLPIAQLENQRAAKHRRLGLFLLKDNQWPKDERLANIAKNIALYYRVKTDNATLARQLLAKRADQIPEQLIIAQAAIESGWGSSRFALEGNSLFGQWSFEKGSGIVPADRQDGLSHQVKAFEDLQESVRSYMLNLNTNRAYRELRTSRAEMRKNGQTLNAHKLAEGLHRYSQRGESYVEELQQLMQQPMFRAISLQDK